MELTKEQAIALYKAEWWIGKGHREIAAFQLFEERLCVPWEVFHEAVEKALGRAVFTHEFATGSIERLRKEFLGEVEAPSEQEILALLPQDKHVVIVVCN